MIINHNLPAMNTQRQLGLNTNNTSKALEKLSSGYRINTAGDDAAGLAISEKMRAQIRGLEMASKNTQDAISLVQTAEGALQETHNILQRMRELAVQSASDTNEESVDRAALQAEFKQLQHEINDISTKTRFNDQNLIDGTYQKDRQYIGSGSTATFINKLTSISVERSVLLGTNAIKWAVTSGQAATVTAGTVATAAVSGGGYTGVAAGATVTFVGAETAEHNGNTYTLNVLGNEPDNMTFQLLDSNGDVVSTLQGVDTTVLYSGSSAKFNFAGVGQMTIALSSGRIDETNFASLTSLNGTSIAFSDGKDQVITPQIKGSVAFTFNGETVTLHKGDTTVNFINNGIAFEFTALSDKDLTTSGITLKFGTATSGSIDIRLIQGTSLTIQAGANQGDELRLNIDAMNTRTLGVEYSKIDTRENASKAITEVNNAINLVSTQRAALGAVSNRLTHKTANLDTSAENLQAAESRIRDADMAKEMMKYTQASIMTQAATAMLAQANQLPQNVLQLLR